MVNINAKGFYNAYFTDVGQDKIKKVVLSQHIEVPDNCYEAEVQTNKQKREQISEQAKGFVPCNTYT